MRSLLLALVLAPLTGCAGLGAADYYQFEEGNSWEYFVRDSELTDEQWVLSIKDGDDNDQGGNGRFYFELMAYWKDATNPNIDYEEPRRRFNISPDFGGLGEDADIIAWQYKQVNNDEGRRNENFAVAPGDDPDWSETWDFSINGSGGGSDFDFEITASYSDEEIQTTPGTFDQTLHIERVRTTTSNNGGEVQVLTSVREEWYVADIGLIRYRDTASDGQVVEGVLRRYTLVGDAADEE